jgi:hypothetical protein
VHVSGRGPVIGGCVVVDRCTSTAGFAFWTVVGVEACPDFPCCDTVPPQLPLLIILSFVLELDTGFRHELLIDAACLTSPECFADALADIIDPDVNVVMSKTITIPAIAKLHLFTLSLCILLL